MTVSTMSGVSSGNGVQHPGIAQMLEVAIEALRVVGEDRLKSRRMADAATTCALHITDMGEATGFTALLDRDPIEVVDHVLPDAQARIFGTAEAWLPVFLTGNLGIAILRGDLKFDGPVRDFLRVFPIFRTAYAEVARGRRTQAAA